MSDQLKLGGKRIAFLTANEGVEQVELTEPWDAVREAGAEAELLVLPGGVANPDQLRRTLTSWPSLQTDLYTRASERKPGQPPNPVDGEGGNDATAWSEERDQAGSPVRARQEE